MRCSHVALYAPIAAVALFLNILIHPLDDQVQVDLDILASSIGTPQDFPPKSLTESDVECVRELNRLISELTRLGNKAICKAKQENKVIEQSRSQN